MLLIFEKIWLTVAMFLVLGMALYALTQEDIVAIFNKYILGFGLIAYTIFFGLYIIYEWRI